MFKVIVYRENSSGEEEEITINDVTKIDIEEVKAEKKKKHVFSVKKYLEDPELGALLKTVPGAFAELDGKEAVIKGNHVALVGGTLVHPDWCIEVED